MKNQFVILAAGKGTRMGNSPVPKVLVMLKNKPLILHLLHELEKINQLISPVVVVGFMADKVRGVLGDDYLYAYQSQQLGTAHALLCAKPQIKAENILVLNGDIPFIKAESLRALIRLHLKSRGLVSLCTSCLEDFSGPNKMFEHYGRIVRTPSGDVIRIVEYKDADEEQKKITEINTGIYMFNTKWLFENISGIKSQNAQEEYYLTDIVKIAIAQGVQVNSVLIDPQEAIGINSEADLKLAGQMLMMSN